MNSLATASPDELLQLASRARRGCVVFDRHPLPLGCSPSEGRVGLEQESLSDAVALHIDRRVHYTGQVDEVARWVSQGAKSFESVGTAAEWLGAVLSPSPTQTSPLFIDPLELADRVGQEIVGQRLALETIARASSRHLARLHPRRPLSILMVGPTGVGKTLAADELVAALREITHRAWPFERLDMTELSEAHSVAKLHGSPPGYVGYRDQTPLVETLRQSRESLVLFDEIEKAHPKVFLSIMNLLDAGRFQASDGGTPIDARQGIMLFTSNVATDNLLHAIDNLGQEPTQLQIDEAGRRHLRNHGVPPELVGRLTHVCVFMPLSAEELRHVALASIDRVAVSYGLTLNRVAPEVVEQIVAASASSGAGVRGLEYAVDAMFGDVFVAARRDGLTEGALNLTQGQPCIA